MLHDARGVTLPKSSIRPRHCIILAAGRGSRLGPLTEETPKCLLPVGGRLLVDWQLDALAAAGITEVIVVSGFQADKLEAHIGGRCRVIRNEAWAATNSIASLCLAAPLVRGHPFVVQNGDVLYARELIGRFVDARRENACLIDPLVPYMAGEYHVELEGGRVVRYSREVSRERSAGMSAQLFRVGAADSAAFLDRLVTIGVGSGAQGFPNQAYDVLMAGAGLWPVFTAGLPWWEVDTAEDYVRCRTAFGEQAPDAGTAMRRRWSSTRDLFRARRLPSRLEWLPVMMRSVLSNPTRASAHVRAFRRGARSRDALDLAVNGLPFLRLLLDEAERTHVTVMLLWGTLLGCVRDGNTIPGDHDLDLGVMAGDADKLPALRDRMLKHGFQVRIENGEKLSFVHPRHRRLFLDLDVVRPHPRGWVIVNADADPTRRFHYVFPHAVFDRIGRARLAGQLDVAVPGDSEGFLTAVYGDWRVPRGRIDFLYGPNNVEVEVLS